MTSNEEAERLLRNLGDDDIVVIGDDGRPQETGRSLAATDSNRKAVVGISDSQGEYGSPANRPPV